MPISETIRAYVQQDGTVPAACPACGSERQFHSREITTRGRPILIQCSCGERFPVLAEFRKAYRRAVTLGGTYRKGLSKDEQGEILVKNLSMMGAAFTTTGNHRLSQGDEITVRMVLGDGRHTEIEAMAVVVHVCDALAGCAFKVLSPQQEDALASYLMLIP